MSFTLFMVKNMKLMKKRKGRCHCHCPSMFSMPSKVFHPVS